MSPEEYQKAAVALERPVETFRCREEEEPAWLYRLLHAQVGLCGEAGEFAGLVKPLYVRGKPLDPLAVLDEIGDVIWYATLALDAAGMSLDDAMEWNIVKLQRRREHGKDKDAEMALLKETLG